jgi:hypothetical protein
MMSQKRKSDRPSSVSYRLFPNPLSTKNQKPWPRRHAVRFASLGAIVLVAIFLLTVSANRLRFTLDASAQQTSIPATENHPFHEGPPDGPLPQVVDANEFQEAVVRNAYRIAAGLRDVLYQEPCYCHCDRHLGHSSLLDCYASKHTKGCTICLQELFYVSEQRKMGKSPEQIREGIIHGEWENVDLSRYQTSVSQDRNPDLH